MGWFRENAFAIAIGTLLVSGGLLVVVLGYVSLVVYAALTAGVSLVGVVTDLAVPYLPIVAVLVVLLTVSTVGVSWGLLRRLSLPKSDRLGSAAERAEKRYPVLDELGIADALTPPEPTTEEKLEALKRRYVTGEIDETTFERELDRFVADDSVDDERVRTEREAALNRRTS